MRVLASGASGLIGSALIPVLAAHGHQVLRLVRSEGLGGQQGVRWDPDAGYVDSSGLRGVDAVVHLAGQSLGGRWTAAKKSRIRESRVKGTRLLAGALASLERPPAALISASAIRYYGDRGEEVLTEESGPGPGYLAEICREWEEATQSAADKGVRVVNLRFGVVVSAAGGHLARMLLPFRLGLGWSVGNGRQYVSWVAVDDAVGAIEHALMTASLRGPVNVVSPDPVTNREFAKTLGRVLRRPAMLRLPAFLARALFGQLADELLLASQRAEPARLRASGYLFRFPELEGALSRALGKVER